VVVATRLPHTPPFSRLLRHAGGYSRTILTSNLQGLELFISVPGQNPGRSSRGDSMVLRSSTLVVDQDFAGSNPTSENFLFRLSSV